MKLYDEIKWCGYDWYIIAIDENKYTLLMKDILKGKDYLDEDEIEFDSKTYVWKASSIRKVLNDKFIKELNKDDMVEMTTSTTYDEKVVETKDYVRLLGIKEVVDLPYCIRQCDDYWWLGSPSIMDTYGNAYVFNVNSDGNVSYSYVDNTYGLRPVVSLLPSVIDKINNNTLEEPSNNSKNSDFCYEELANKIKELESRIKELEDNER